MSVSSLANRSFKLQRQTTTQDAAGGQTKVWNSVMTLRGRIQPLRLVLGHDQIIHAKGESRITHRGYFTGTPDIRAGDRFNTGTDLLHVQGVRNIDYAGRFTTVELEERDQ